MSKKRTHANKNQNQSRQYKQALKTIQGCQSTDDNENFSLLQRSDEGYVRDNNVQKDNLVSGVKRQKIKRFFKNHLFETCISLVLTIIVSIAGWTIANLISVKEDLAVFSYRIEKIEENLKDIETDSVTKEFLEQEIKILKLEIESASAKDIAKLELRINLLESQLANLQEKND